MKHLEVPLLSFHSIVYQRLILFFFPESADSLLMGVLLIMLIMLF